MRSANISPDEGTLTAWLAGQQDMRSAAKAKAASRWTWGAAGLMPVLAFLWAAPIVPRDIAVLASLGGAVLVGLWGYQPIAAATKTIKVGINAAIAQSFGVSYAHDVEPGAEFTAACTYGLLPDHDRAAFEDYWHGSLEGHAFGLYEANLQEQRGSGKNRRWVTVFRGVVIRMVFGRDFRSTTLLERAGKHRKWLGLGGASEHVSFDGHRLDRVDQVHPAFSDSFALYSDDRVEARVLVHPTYVEHLLRLEGAFAAKELRALFKAGEVVIAVEGDDLFESGAMDPATDRVRAERTAAQFSALAGLALAINQNERGRIIAPAPHSAVDL